MLDPVFLEAEESFSNVSTLLEAGGDSSSFLEDEDFVSAPRKSSRKRPRSSAAAGRPKREHNLWGELEQKPGIRPKRAQIEHELDDDEVEPIPDAHYGLLGTRSWEVPRGSIGDLPAEVLRSIFAFLPVTDLFQSVSLVCHCWRDVVSDPLVSPALGLSFSAALFFSQCCGFTGCCRCLPAVSVSFRPFNSLMPTSFPSFLIQFSDFFWPSALQRIPPQMASQYWGNFP